jgi:hypothetical protein
MALLRKLLGHICCPVGLLLDVGYQEIAGGPEIIGVGDMGCRRSLERGDAILSAGFSGIHPCLFFALGGASTGRMLRSILWSTNYPVNVPRRGPNIPHNSTAIAIHSLDLRPLLAGLLSNDHGRSRIIHN